MSKKILISLWAASLLAFSACDLNYDDNAVDGDDNETPVTTDSGLSVSLEGENVEVEMGESCAKGYENGEYKIVLKEDDLVVSELDLGTLMLAPDGFEVEELPSGTVAYVQTYGSCNGDMFEFYKVDEETKSLEKIAFPGDIMQVLTGPDDFSFEDGNLDIRPYNNAIGEFSEIQYVLDFEAGRFELVSNGDEGETAPNVFFFEGLEVGQEYGEFEVASISSFNEQDEPSEFSMIVDFKGEAEITGEYNYLTEDENVFFEGLGCITVEGDDLAKLPLYKWWAKASTHMFCFDQEADIDALGQQDGERTVVIGSYTALVLESEIVDIATLKEIIE